VTNSITKLPCVIYPRHTPVWRGGPTSTCIKLIFLYFSGQARFVFISGIQGRRARRISIECGLRQVNKIPCSACPSSSRSCLQMYIPERGTVINLPDKLYRGIGRSEDVDEIRYENLEKAVPLFWIDTFCYFRQKAIDWRHRTESNEMGRSVVYCLKSDVCLNPKNAVAACCGLKIHGCNARFARAFLRLATASTAFFGLNGERSSLPQPIQEYLRGQGS